MRTVWLGLAISLVVGGLSAAADLTQPVWIHTPTRDDRAKAYPPAAAAVGLTGSVKVRCTAMATGSLDQCTVVEETPPGRGFGAAALSLTRQMLLRPTDATGAPIAGRQLDVPLLFGKNSGAVVVNPSWLRRPTQDEIQRLYPATALGEAGSAVIECTLSVRGLLEACTLIKENPPGRGFGAALLAMSPMFLMSPMTVDGVPVGGTKVIIPMRFEGTFLRGSTDGSTIRTLRVRRDARWREAPTADSLKAAFPKGAIGKFPTGHVILQCAVRQDGALLGCEPVLETPAGKGFTEAAQRLSKEFRADLEPGLNLVNLRIDVPFDFRDPTGPQPAAQIDDPEINRQPDAAAMASLFPDQAAKAGLTSGSASVNCLAGQDGSLSDCRVVAEAPADAGFGAAALHFAAVTTINPWSAGGEPVAGARVTLPVAFAR